MNKSPSLIIIIFLTVSTTISLSFINCNDQESMSTPINGTNHDLLLELNNGTVSNVTWEQLSNSLSKDLQQIRERKRRERISLIKFNVLNLIENHVNDNISINILSNLSKSNISDNDLISDLMSILSASSSTPASDINDHDNTTEAITSENDIKMIISPSCPSKKTPSLASHQTLKKSFLFFQLPSPPSNKILSTTTAKLFLFKFAPLNLLSETPSNMVSGGQPPEMGISISVYKISNHGSRGRRRLIDNQTVASNYVGRIEFDVSLILSNWNINSKRNVMFDMDAEDPFGNYQNSSTFLIGVNCSNNTNESLSVAQIASYHTSHSPYIELHRVEKT